MKINEIKQELFNNQDKEYGKFQAGLLPNISAEKVIGVRTPVLRKLAKEIYKQGDFDEFIENLPHEFFEENQLHGFLISEIKDFNLCIEKLNKFLPFVDNWATCDQMSPKVFKKHKGELLEQIKLWLESEMPYTKRFGVGMLMRYFLDEDFSLEFAEMVLAVRSEEYYVKMMVAWYFATALAKQYDKIIPYFEKLTLDKWTHNKAIQKAVESYRISPEQKAYLRGLKVK